MVPSPAAPQLLAALAPLQASLSAGLQATRADRAGAGTPFDRRGADRELPRAPREITPSTRRVRRRLGRAAGPDGKGRRRKTPPRVHRRNGGVRVVDVRGGGVRAGGGRAFAIRGGGDACVVRERNRRVGVAGDGGSRDARETVGTVPRRRRTRVCGARGTTRRERGRTFGRTRIARDGVS